MGKSQTIPTRGYLLANSRETVVQIPETGRQKTPVPLLDRQQGLDAGLARFLLN